MADGHRDEPPEAMAEQDPRHVRHALVDERDELGHVVHVLGEVETGAPRPLGVTVPAHVDRDGRDPTLRPCVHDVGVAAAIVGVSVEQRDDDFRRPLGDGQVVVERRPARLAASEPSFVVADGHRVTL